jgi:hypothetical protein
VSESSAWRPKNPVTPIGFWSDIEARHDLMRDFD